MADARSEVGEGLTACPGRSAARSSCEAVRCRAGAVTSAGVWYGPGSAERHEECRTASGTQPYLLFPARLSKNTPCSPNMFQNHHGALSRSGRP
jgi:hypothetical protein